MKENISVCMGKNCRNNGSSDVFDLIDQELRLRQCPVLKNFKDLELKINLCKKFCDEGPLVVLGNYVLLNMNRAKTSLVLESYFRDEIEYQDVVKISELGLSE